MTRLSVPLRGAHQAANAMLAVATAQACGVPLDEAAAGLEVLDRALALQLGQHLARPGEHRLRQPGEAGHVDAVGAVGRALGDAVQEEHRASRLVHGDVDVGEPGEALGELAQLHPLTQFDGIETQDRYDEKVVLALLPIARAGVEADSTLPAEEDAVAFNAAMGKLPPLGPNPVGFMVLSVVQGSLAAADSLRRLPDYPAGSADKLALRLIRHLTSDFAAAREDFIRQAKVDAFRQSSVIMRLRCPRDGSPYKVSDMKNNLSDSGQVSTIYFLNCTGCDSPESLHFRLEVASRLNQASEKQPLKQQPQPKRPNPGLEP